MIKIHVKKFLTFKKKQNEKFLKASLEVFNMRGSRTGKKVFTRQDVDAHLENFDQIKFSKSFGRISSVIRTQICE